MEEEKVYSLGEKKSEISYDEYVNMLKQKSYNILSLLSGMNVEQARRVLNMALENLELSATVDSIPLEL